MAHIKKIVRKFLKSLKRGFVKAVIRIVQRKRLGRNSHDLRSIEITTLEQHINFEKPSPVLLGLVSQIAAAYSGFDYQAPPDLHSIWDTYNHAYVGEHYRLLPIVVNTLRAVKVVEIGTFKGASAAAILQNTDAHVISYDVYSCRNFVDCYIRSEYFGARFTERIGDLYEKEHAHTLLNDLKGASLVFLDGPKNFHFEKYILDTIFKTAFDHDLWLLIDDIRVSTMVDLWNKIPYPKADISFIGHWSGTGLVYLPKDR